MLRKVIDLEFDISVVMDSAQNQGQVITKIIDEVLKYMAPHDRTWVKMYFYLD